MSVEVDDVVPVGVPFWLAVWPHLIVSCDALVSQLRGFSVQLTLKPLHKLDGSVRQIFITTNMYKCRYIDKYTLISYI